MAMFRGDGAPGGGTALWRGNEPAGMTFLDDRAFNALDEPGWGVPVEPGATIVSDPTAPRSPPNIMTFNYPAGFQGGSGPESSSYTPSTFYRVLYLCYWFKYSSNWWGHATGVNKHGYVWDGNDPIFVYECEGVGAGPLTTRMAVQVPVSQPNSDGWYPQNVAPGALWTRGQWGLMEILLTGSHAGVADGGIDFWMNGVLAGHWTNIQWKAGDSSWVWVRLAPIWGGVGDSVPADQFLAFDDYYISGKN